MTFDDGIAFSLPTLAECGEMRRRSSRAARDLPVKPWPQERPDPELERLRDRYPHAHRIGIAFQLAVDVESAAALLAGEPVDPARVNRDALRWARERVLVRLDLRAIDLLLEVPAP